MTYLPKITIVTPSFNQATYLAQTIESVLSQGYPNLEYIIMDGGSTDGSADIIKKYADHLAFWISEKDNGQAAAINAGFARATGEIHGWLNSDDFYMPGTLAKAAARLSSADPAILVGNCIHFRQNSPEKWGSSVPEKLRSSNLLLWDFIEQPSTFWTSAAWETVGPLDASLDFALDWDWFIRAKLAGIPFLDTSDYLSSYRYHENHKTSTGGSRRNAELVVIYERYAQHYQAVLQRCFVAQPRLKTLRKAVMRCRLDRWQGRIFRTIFPRCFRGVPDNDIRDVLECIG